MKKTSVFVSAGTLLSCFTIGLLSTGPLLGADDVPLWKKGISAWSGKGYTLPPGTTATETVAGATAAPPRYTVPVDPAAVAASAEQSMGADLAWLESFAASDAIAKKTPTAPTYGNIAGDAVSQVAAQAPMLEAPINLGVIEEHQLDSITQRIASGEAIDAGPPLQQEVMQWYQYPWVWMTTGWTNHAEFGLDGSKGNAETLSITTGIDLKRKTDYYTLGIDVDYRQASNRGAITQDNGRMNIDYDRIIADSKWTAFGKFGLEWDRFKAFDLRLNTNAGLGYYWIKDDMGLFITRFGAGASKEIGAPDDAWVPEAVFGAEAERQITERQKLKGKIDYFPAWNDFANYRLVSDVSWEILLDGTDNLSLKLSATDRYDSTPQGALPNDVYYSALILYKF